MVDFVNNVRSFVNYAIFCELCDWMRFEVDFAKSHHRVISEGLTGGVEAAAWRAWVTAVLIVAIIFEVGHPCPLGPGRTGGFGCDAWGPDLASSAGLVLHFRARS